MPACEGSLVKLVGTLDGTGHFHTGETSSFRKMLGVDALAELAQLVFRFVAVSACWGTSAQGGGSGSTRPLADGDGASRRRTGQGEQPPAPRRPSRSRLPDGYIDCPLC
jgi:hypothetical protein